MRTKTKPKRKPKPNTLPAPFPKGVSVSLLISFPWQELFSDARRNKEALEIIEKNECELERELLTVPGVLSFVYDYEPSVEVLCNVQTFTALQREMRWANRTVMRIVNRWTKYTKRRIASLEGATDVSKAR